MQRLNFNSQKAKRQREGCLEEADHTGF